MARVLIPLAQGCEELEAVTVIDLLQRYHAQDRFAAAICAAPKVLANAGLLAGKSATGYPGAVLIEEFPEIDLVDVPVVVDGKVITSRGPGTAMDFALQLVESLAGKAKRDEVETALVREI